MDDDGAKLAHIGDKTLVYILKSTDEEIHHCSYTHSSVIRKHILYMCHTDKLIIPRLLKINTRQNFVGHQNDIYILCGRFQENTCNFFHFWFNF